MWYNGLGMESKLTDLKIKKMDKNEVKDFIYKHFKNKDIGIGVLSCIHDDKTVDELAENLVDLFSIPFVSFCVCETPTPEKIHGIIKACTTCKKAIKRTDH